MGLVLAAACILALFVPVTAHAGYDLKKPVGNKEFKLTLYGFSQLEARTGDGLADPDDGDLDDDGLRFSAQRIRVGWNYHYGQVFGKLFVDFNKSHSRSRAGLPEMIKDAFVGYKWSNQAFAKIGMFKAPVGMAFTIPGWNMDTVERNLLDKGMVFERDMGVMLSGRLIGSDNPKISGREMGHEPIGRGWGYDLFLGNNPGRSAAVKGLDQTDHEPGDVLAWAARLHYDFGDGGKGKPRHFEVSYGKAEEAGGPSWEEDLDEDGTVACSAGECYEAVDYTVFDAALNVFYLDGKLNVKLEYIKGENILGVEGWDQDCLTTTLGYMVHPQVEAVVRHYAASVTRGDSDDHKDTDLGNTYIGFSFYLEPQDLADHRKLQSHRIQINYVKTSGDDGICEEDGSIYKDWTGKWGYLDDVLILQYQYKF
jgi:hypothetical protein